MIVIVCCRQEIEGVIIIVISHPRLIPLSKHTCVFSEMINMIPTLTKIHGWQSAIVFIRDQAALQAVHQADTWPDTWVDNNYISHLSLGCFPTCRSRFYIKVTQQAA